MRYVNLGRTGLKISAIALGCGNFGGMGSVPALFGKVATREESLAIMDKAWELGINYFDTANSYGGGLSESFIGEWLKQKGTHVRNQVILSTKVYSPVGDGPNDQGLSRQHILRQIDISLRRLGADHLDLYIIHAPDPNTPLEETLCALDDLIHQLKFAISAQPTCLPGSWLRRYGSVIAFISIVSNGSKILIVYSIRLTSTKCFLFARINISAIRLSAHLRVAG